MYWNSNNLTIYHENYSITITCNCLLVSCLFCQHSFLDSPNWALIDTKWRQSQEGLLMDWTSSSSIGNDTNKSYFLIVEFLNRYKSVSQIREMSTLDISKEFKGLWRLANKVPKSRLNYRWVDSSIEMLIQCFPCQDLCSWPTFFPRLRHIIVFFRLQVGQSSMALMMPVNDF